MPVNSGSKAVAPATKTPARTPIVRQDTALVSYVKTGGAPRPTLTDEGKGVIARMSANGHNIPVIADALGLTNDQLKVAMKNDPALRAIFDEGRERLSDELASGLLAQARKGNVTCAIFLLKAMAGWRDTGVDTGKGAPQVAVQINLPQAMSPDDYARLIKVAPAGEVADA